MSKKLRDFFIIAILFFGILCLFEVSLRISGYMGNHYRSILFGNDPNSIMLFENSASLWWRLRPNTAVSFLNTPVITDSEGLRIEKNYRATAAKNANYTPKVFCIGDSSTFGWRLPYAQSYPHRLEKLLKTSFKNPKVYNLGVPGYTSFQAKQYLAEKLNKIQPDIVIVYLSNNECSLARKSDQTRRKQEEKYLRFKELVEDLKIYHLAQDYAWKMKGPFFLDKEMRLEDYLRMLPRVTINEFEQNITDIITSLKDRQIPLIMLTVPYSLKADFKFKIPSGNQKVDSLLDQAEAAIAAGSYAEAERLISLAKKFTPEYYRSNYLKAKVLDLKGYNAIELFEDAIEKYPFPSRLKNSYNEVIRKTAAINSVPCLDLYAVFRSYQQSDHPSYFIDTNHPKAHGYAIIANLIHTEVKKLLIKGVHGQSDFSDSPAE